MKLQTKPRTIILTSLFCIVAGALLIFMDSWFGYAPLAYGVIMLMAGFVAARHEDLPAETEQGH